MIRVGSTGYLDEFIVEEMKRQILASEEYADDLMDAPDYVKYILSLSLSTVDRRRKIRLEVVSLRKYLYLWRLINGEPEWLDFMAELHANRVNKDDLSLIRNLVNETYIHEYELFKEALTEQRSVLFTGVLSSSYDKATKHLSVVFEDVDYANKVRQLENNKGR